MWRTPSWLYRQCSYLGALQSADLKGHVCWVVGEANGSESYPDLLVSVELTKMNSWACCFCNQCAWRRGVTTNSGFILRRTSNTFVGDGFGQVVEWHKQIRPRFYGLFKGADFDEF